MKQIFPSGSDGLLKYDIAPEVTAFSPLRDAVLPIRVVQAHQVHGDRVAVVTSAGTTREELKGYDALVTDVPGVAIGARTADCIPVLMYDPVRRVVAAVHSGWKGTVLKITAKVLAVMASKYGTQPKDILAAIGPGIGPDSFQVGPEVAEAFLAAGFPETWSRPDTDDYGTASTGKTVVRLITDRGPRIPGSMSGGLHIDLPQAVRLTLIRAGVHDPNILISGIDTYTHPGFFSAAQSLSLLLFSPHDRVEPTGSQRLERYANTRVRAYEGLTVSTDAPHFHNQLFFTALPIQRESFAPSQSTGKHTPLS